MFDGPTSSDNKDIDNIRWLIDALNAEKPGEAINNEENALTCPLPPLFEAQILSLNTEKELLPKSPPISEDNDEQLSLGCETENPPAPSPSLSSGTSGSEYRPKRKIKPKAPPPEKVARRQYLKCSNISLEQCPGIIADLQTQMIAFEAQKNDPKSTNYQRKILIRKIERKKSALTKIQKHFLALKEKRQAPSMQPVKIVIRTQQPKEDPPLQLGCLASEKEQIEAQFVEVNTDLLKQITILKKFINDSLKDIDATKKELNQTRQARDLLAGQILKNDKILKDLQLSQLDTKRTVQQLQQECADWQQCYEALKKERESLIDNIEGWANAYDELNARYWYERDISLEQAHQEQIRSRSVMFHWNQNRHNGALTQQSIPTHQRIRSAKR